MKASSTAGDTQTETTSFTITNAQDSVCNYSVRLFPETVLLRDGQTTATLQLGVWDSSGNVISPPGQVSFTTSNPSLVQVDASGVVTSTGFGEAQIVATVQGLPRTATSNVVAGRFQVLPPILLLAVGAQPTGQLTLNVANADGTAMNLAGHTITFQGGNAVASVDNTGNVTALRPPQTFNETPVLSATLDGLPSHNGAVIRVTSSPLGISLTPLQKLNIAFYIPGQIGSYNYPQIFQAFDAARITDLAYQVEVELSGQAPNKGDLQFLVNDPGHNSDGTVPCGLNGNPVRLGTDVDTYSSCMVGVSLGTPTPQWGVFFHEMGHNFTLASNRFTQFVNGSNVPNSNDAYVEGLATGVGIYVAQMMKSRAAQYGISPDILNSILFSVWRFGSTPDLDSYVQNGSNYSTIDPDVSGRHPDGDRRRIWV